MGRYGFLLLYKRLETGKFQWPRDSAEVEAISPQQYKWLMEGISIEQKIQLEQVNQNMKLILEQLSISKHKQFGSSSEKMVYVDQLEMCFNEAEVTIANKFVIEPELEEVCPKPYKRKKTKGKRDEDLKIFQLQLLIMNYPKKN